MDHLHEGFQVISPEFRYLYVNNTVVAQGKSTREALLGQTMESCYPGIEGTEMFSILRRVMEEREPASMENAFTYPDGSVGWFELRFEPVPEGVTILSIDISDRKRVEHGVQRASQALGALGRCNKAVALSTDGEELIDAFCEILRETNYPDARFAPNEPDISSGSLAFEVMVEDERVGALVIGEAPPLGFAEEERRALAEIASDLGAGIQVLRERAEHRRLREHLMAVQRLEALGRFAGSVAHDFNNLTSVIVAHTGFALSGLPVDHPIREDLERLDATAARAADLTERLLAFARHQAIEQETVSAASVVRQVEAMLTRVLGEQVKLIVELEEDAGAVSIDAAQVELAIVNLAVNARDAMPDGGTLCIDLRVVPRDAATPDRIEGQEFVRIAVSDTGVGMDAETRAQAFEPFFSTKPAGEGTGLGLPTARGIIRGCGGYLTLESEPGKGTAVSIILPRVGTEPETRSAPTAAELAPRTETILLVEDDPWVRRAIERMLTLSGHEVLTAPGPDDARTIFETDPMRIDLLISDVVMPAMSGPELAAALRAARPDLKVLFVSGYTGEAVGADRQLDARTGFLKKPFSMAALNAKVAEILDAP